MGGREGQADTIDKHNICNKPSHIERISYIPTVTGKCYVEFWALLEKQFNSSVQWSNLRQVYCREYFIWKKRKNPAKFKNSKVIHGISY